MQEEARKKEVMRRLMASDVPSRPVEPAADENFDIFADEDDQQVRRLSIVSQFPLKIKFHNSFCNNKVRFLLNTITTCPLPAHYLPTTYHYLPTTCPLPTHYLPLPTHYLPLPTHYLPLPTHYLPLPTHYLPLPTHYTPTSCPKPTHYHNLDGGNIP